MAAADRVHGALKALVASPRVHRFVLLVADAVITAVCFQAAMLLRFEGHISDPYLQTLYPLTLMFAACRVLANLLLGIHRWSFRFSGLSDGARIGMAGLSGTGLLLGILYLVQVPGTPGRSSSSRCSFRRPSWRRSVSCRGSPVSTRGTGC